MITSVTARIYVLLGTKRYKHTPSRILGYLLVYLPLKINGRMLLKSYITSTGWINWILLKTVLAILLLLG